MRKKQKGNVSKSMSKLTPDFEKFDMGSQFREPEANETICEFCFQNSKQITRHRMVGKTN